MAEEYKKRGEKGEKGGRKEERFTCGSMAGLQPNECLDLTHGRPAGRTNEKLSATAGSVAATTRAVSSDGVHQLAAVEELRHISTEHFCLRGEDKSVL